METFVVRVWVPPPGTGWERDPPLRGTLEAARGGSITAFRDLEELATLLRDGVRAAGPATPVAPTRPKPSR